MPPKKGFYKKGNNDNNNNYMKNWSRDKLEKKVTELQKKNFKIQQESTRKGWTNRGLRMALAQVSRLYANQEKVNVISFEDLDDFQSLDDLIRNVKTLRERNRKQQETIFKHHQKVEETNQKLSQATNHLRTVLQQQEKQQTTKESKQEESNDENNSQEEIVNDDNGAKPNNKFSLKCPICFEMYDDDKQFPFCLSGCGHLLCKTCLIQLKNKKEDQTNCPVCRSENPIEKIIPIFFD